MALVIILIFIAEISKVDSKTGTHGSNYHSHNWITTITLDHLESLRGMMEVIGKLMVMLTGLIIYMSLIIILITKEFFLFYESRLCGLL